MPNVAIYCHGGRKVGTSMGTYMVPPGVTLYFFTEDTEAMKTNWATYFLERLCRQAPEEEMVKRYAFEIKRAWETVPNYQLKPDAQFRHPTGVYVVGQNVGAGPAVPINGPTWLSDIIGGAGRGGPIGSEIYFLACRFKGSTAHKSRVAPSRFVSAERVPGGQGLTTEIAAKDEALTEGYSPSEIKRWGGTYQAETLRAKAREEYEARLRAAQRVVRAPPVVANLRCEICNQVFPSRVRLTAHQANCR